MAQARKLPSGSWRCQVYSHMEKETQPDGSVKNVRKYESFTSDIPTLAGKAEAEYLAAEFKRNRKRIRHTGDLTVLEAINRYVQSTDHVLSPATIQGYNSIKENSFQGLMSMQLKKLTPEILQEAVNKESVRPSKKYTKNPRPISPKTVSNSYGLLTAVINKYCPTVDCKVRLPAKEKKIKELLPPEIIYDVVKGTDIELAVLLAMWLSYSMSEVRGLTKSKSLATKGFLTIKEVIVDINGEPVRKSTAKTLTRIRKHRIPEHIQKLIDETDPDVDALVPFSSHALYRRFTRMLKSKGLPHMTFHDLRHVNASVMALLQIQDKYAQERGGWKTDKVMKDVYTHTFSEQRQAADDLIDDYFNQNIINPGKAAEPEKKSAPEYIVATDFDYNKLLQLGYIYIPLEGGYMSPNAATIVYQSSEKQTGKVTLFIPGREEKHVENIRLLLELGLIKDK